MPAESSIVFYNGSNYDGCFIIKKLAEDLKEQFLWKHTKKYITFSVLIEKVVIKIDKKGKENTKTYTKSYKNFTGYNLWIEQYLWQVHYQSCK